MNERMDLAEPFARLRAHLHSVAYRILGSASDADDDVQEAWMRLDRGDTDEIENLGGWLTTVVARICLDMLRSRRSRPEEPLEEWLEESAVGTAAPDADKEIVLAESVGGARSARSSRPFSRRHGQVISSRCSRCLRLMLC